MTTWKAAYISAVVHRSADDPMLAEVATRICLIDEGGGAFVELEDGDGNKLRLDPDELRVVAETAQKMLCDVDGKPSEDRRAIDETPDADDAVNDDYTKQSIVNKFAACDLLAVIHRDGGNHTGKVGMVQSCKDAEAVVRALRIDSDLLDSTLATNAIGIVNCLFRYIDRMNDVCDEDPADRILREFVADVMPFINYRKDMRMKCIRNISE